MNVRDVMTPIAVHADKPAAAAGAVPTRDLCTVVGVVTRGDLFNALVGPQDFGAANSNAEEDTRGRQRDPRHLVPDYSWQYSDVTAGTAGPIGGLQDWRCDRSTASRIWPRG